MLKYDYILIYWLVVVKRTNIFQELIHADVKNMSVKAVGNKNCQSVIICTLHAGVSKWAGTRYFYPPEIVYSTGRNY